MVFKSQKTCQFEISLINTLDSQVFHVQGLPRKCSMRICLFIKKGILYQTQVFVTHVIKIESKCI